MAPTPTKRPQADGEEEEPTSKRGRGRPRKYPPKDPNAPKRPRGRPRKDPNAPPRPPKDPNAPSRGRGRPPKERLAEDPNAPKRARGRPLKDPSEMTSDKPKQGLGRPRKSDAEGSLKPPSVTQAYKGKQSKKAKPTGLLTDLVGTYTLRCDEIEGNWPNVAEDMALSVSSLPHTSSALIASFDLGILEGTMLLAADEASLERVRKQLEKNDDPPMDKKSATPAIANRSLYFTWRGRNTGDDDEVHPGTSNDQKGTLKFMDDRLLKFKGRGTFPALGQDCVFFGTQVDGQPESEAEPWSSFSEEAREEANRDRWR